MKSKRFLVAVLVLSFAAVALPLSVTAEAPVLWQNGVYDHWGLLSGEPEGSPGSFWRAADDFELPTGCLWYTIKRIRGEMLLTQGNVPHPHVEIYADSGGNGPAGAALHTFPMSNAQYLGAAGVWEVSNDPYRYEFTFETPGLTLLPGRHWLSLYNVDQIGNEFAWFAATAKDTHQLQAAYQRADPWTWQVNYDKRDAIFEVDGFCVYAFTGFFSPVDNPPTVNVVKAGTAVPVRFSLGGDEGLDIFSAGYPMSHQVACDNGALLDSVEETVTAGASGLQYDPATQEYTYVWKTNKTWTRTCREFVLGLNDGSDHTAVFDFK